MCHNMLNISIAKDAWDYYYIFTTTIIALGVCFVAFLQFKTIRKQALHEVFIESEKLKHDLFEKRYAVFITIYSVLSKVLETGLLSSEELYKFRSEILSADFLFDTEIATYIDKLYNELASMVSQLHNPHGKSDRTLGDEDNARMKSFDNHIKSIHTVFASHLKFEIWNSNQK